MWSAADEVALLCEGAGFQLYPWQIEALRVVLAERADGKWSARDAAFLVSRQNGKGGVLHALGLAGLFLFEDVREILHSAHEHKTAKKAYRELKGIIEGCPQLLAQVERRGRRIVGFRQSNEDTSITIGQPGPTQRVIRFVARSKGSGRGFSPQMVIMDEAQECSFLARDALNYTLRAQPNPLITWCGTVPAPENNCEVFTWLRDRGRKGGDRSLSWQEWSPPMDCDLKSDDALEWSNPSLGFMIEWETLDLEREAALSSDEVWEGWCREALSWWPDDDPEQAGWKVITKAAWEACATNEKRETPGWLTGLVTIGIDTTADREWSSVAAAGECREGGIGVEVVKHGPGTAWVVEHVQALAGDGVRAVVVDPGGPAGSLIQDLEAAGVEVTPCPTSDLTRATGSMVDGIEAAEVKHRDRPELTEAARTALTRQTASGAWLFDRRASGVVSPLIASTLARWGHMELPEPEAYALAVYA